MTVHRQCPQPCGLLETWGPGDAPRSVCRQCKKEAVDLPDYRRVAPPPKEEKKLVTRRKATR